MWETTKTLLFSLFLSHQGQVKIKRKTKANNLIIRGIVQLYICSSTVQLVGEEISRDYNDHLQKEEKKKEKMKELGEEEAQE